ncbi:MAG: DUF4397 domain-containing protein, partial [Anaerolineales bacterium]|nr:DUF4397 domain-containing protein [Anaerolineales bacterium]
MKTVYKYFVTLFAAASLLIGSTIPAIAANGFPPTSDLQNTNANAIVNVAHFAPFAPDQADTAVTVRVNGADALTGFEFGETVAELDFAPGEYLIEIIPDILGSVAISGTFDLAADTQYTLSAIGDGTNQDLELFALVDETEPLTNAAKLRV